MRKVAYVLNTDIPVVPEDAEKEVKDKMTMELAFWNENDYLCKNFILISMIIIAHISLPN